MVLRVGVNIQESGLSLISNVPDHIHVATLADVDDALGEHYGYRYTEECGLAQTLTVVWLNRRRRSIRRLSRSDLPPHTPWSTRSSKAY